MSVLPHFSWPVPSNTRGSNFASQEDMMSHLDGEATGWFMLGSNGMWHGGIHITSTTTPWCALSGKAVSELLDFPVPYKGEQSVRCMADGDVVAYRICRDYLNVPWETGPLNVSGSFVLVRHYIQPGEKKENGLHFYTLYMHLAPYSAYASSENETRWIVNDKLPVFRREWVPDASAENRNKYRISSIPKGSLIEWDATNTGCSATGPRARRYGLVTFRGQSGEAKTGLVEGQQYWILTDRDNLAPASGAAVRPSWWSHLLPPYAEPMQFDTVVCPTPYPVSAGDGIGHLGYFQVPKDDGYDSRYQVHIECLSADYSLPAFLKNPEKVGEGTPLYLKCPPGLPLFSKDLTTRTLVSDGRVTQGEAILKLSQVKTELDAEQQEYWFLPYANGYVPKSNKSAETVSQYALEKLGFTTTVDEAPGFDHLDGITSPKGLVRSILNRLLAAASADTRLTHRAVPHNYQRLLNRIDSSVSPYASREYLSAIHNPSYRDIKSRMIVKHPSEWYHKKETSFWQSFLNKLTSDAPEWREYCEAYLDKMVWMQDAGKLKLGSSLWHMHPVVFLGAFIRETKIRKEMLRKIWTDSARVPDILLSAVAEELNASFERCRINTSNRLNHFIAQVFQEVGPGFNLNENFNYRANVLVSKFSYYANHVAEAEADGFIPGRQAANAENIANKAYANRGNNGGYESGDGWRYRGRGMKQLTFRGNYRSFTKYHEKKWGQRVDFEVEPDLLLETVYAVRSALYFWDFNNLSTRADQGFTKDVSYSITRIVNQYDDHYDDRFENLKRLLHEGVFNEVF